MRYARDGWAVESGQYKQHTGKLPQWFLERPISHRGDDFYLGAFWELSSCRQFGQVMGPIPWHRIVQYGERKHLDPSMIDVLVAMIRALDESYLKNLREDQKRETERTDRTSKRKRKR